MPTQPGDKQRIAQLQTELQKIGLVWYWHYHLVDEGSWWTLNFLRPVTPDQYNQAQVLLALIMNN